MSLQLLSIAALAATLCTLDSAGLRSSAPSNSTNPSALQSGPLTIACPPTAKFFCGGSTDPSVTGTPTVSGGCPPYTVTFSDQVFPLSCPTGRFDTFITRTWTATDTCGGSVSCTQDLHILKLVVNLDLHPRSCPNPFNLGATGRYPVAILGSATFDVTQIDLNSIQIWLPGCTGGPVTPLTFRFEDVSSPYTGGMDCGCTQAGPDGFLDLFLRFDRQTMESLLHLGSNPHGANVKLVIVGKLTSGCGFLGLDCVRIQ